MSELPISRFASRSAAVVSLAVSSTAKGRTSVPSAAMSGDSWSSLTVLVKMSRE
ncbi:hypothetical protein [Leifsonia shinshuensis]|uniref:hypothetical protein n=1 Tax=Leifsonia shinshuensis TaxID=150026 RepID=UPI0016294D9B|nr:hypothetical protein [Leifsonia shinshuensis]